MKNDTSKQPLRIVPSILSADFTRLAEALGTIRKAGAEWVHVDVMDGHFVPNITIGPPVLASIRKETELFLDVHLMMDNPERLIPDFVSAGADLLTIHVEACTHLNRTIQMIHELGIRAGVSLNPATSLAVLDYLPEQVEMILLMTVNPGFGGQSYIPQMTQKIKDLRAWISKNNKKIDLQIDGGINTSNISEVTDAGANIIVTGSAFFQSPDPTLYMKEMVRLAGI